MLKRLLLSGAALTVTAGLAVAQTSAPPPAGEQTPPHATTGASAPENPAAPNAMSAPDASSPSAMSSGQTAAQAEDPNLYTNVQGADVVDADDKSLGRIADLVVDGSGHLNQVVIGTGGLLGIGETLRAHDAKELPQVADGKVRLTGMTSDSLAALPEYQYPEDTAETGRAATDSSATAPAAGGTVADAQSPAAQAPAGTVAPGGNLPGATTSPADNANNAPAPGGAMAPSGSMASNDSGASADTASASASGTMWPASYLVGATITNAQDSAEINDLRFEGNRIAAVLVDKGSLGLGNDVTEVPFENLNIAGTPKAPEISLKAGTAAEGTAPAK